MTKRASILVTITCAMFLLVNRHAGADTLRMIVERGMIAPGSNKEFLSFGQLDGVAAAISGQNVAFGGLFNGGSGYYASIDGTIVVLADTEMTIPGTEETFGFYTLEGSDPSISGRRVAFFARSSYPVSLWVWEDDVLELIAATNVTIVPGTKDVTFRNFGTLEGGSPSISGENVAFAALINAFQEDARPSAGGELDDFAGDAAEEQGAFIGGIYAYINGQLRVIADSNTMVPGEDVTFSVFDVIFGVSPSISGENVAFGARWPVGNGNSWRGIWTYIDGTLELIARSGDPRPGGGTFGAFKFLDGFGPSISGENVAFHDGLGIFARINGKLRLIADTGSDPGVSAQSITPFLPPRISGDTVVFSTLNPLGIFTYNGGTSQLVMDTSMTIPGHDDIPFQNFGFGEPGISGTNIAFSGGGIGTNGVYLLTKDPPVVSGQSDWSVIAVTLLLLAAASAIILRRLLSSARRG